MGRKIHPKVFRLSTIYRWDSKWFGGRDQYISYLQEDVNIRAFLKKQLKDASVDHIEIDRNANKVTITIFTAKPGVVIGRSGAGIEELKKKIQKKFYRGKRVGIAINVQEVKSPALSSRIVAQQIAQEIERRLPFRRSMKMALERVMKAGAKGAKIQVAGRLNGADIARSEMVHDGSIPLHNLRADVDFARIPARTIYGAIGVKVWIYRGEIFEEKEGDKASKKLEKPTRRKRTNA